MKIFSGFSINLLVDDVQNDDELERLSESAVGIADRIEEFVRSISTPDFSVELSQDGDLLYQEGPRCTDCGRRTGNLKDGKCQRCFTGKEGGDNVSRAY